MNIKLTYSKITTITLVLLRLVVGYHFLYEGMNKLFIDNWSAAPFLLQSNWLFSDFFHFIANNQSLLSVINIVNIWGQIFIGVSLLVGLFSSVTALFGAILILSYYVAVPPFASGNIFVDRNLLELFAFVVIVLFPTSNILGLDFLVKKYGKSNNG